ncbi:MAG: ASKHA domain-containing protein [Gammaproteobacteria bacterium]|nr:ASKHA domain-containing protein [Gammaproteobacteria bacterium]
MPELTILLDHQTHRLVFTPGRSVRDVLEPTPYRVRSGCHGNGACGLCRIRILAGDAGPVTTSEQLHLHEDLLAQGVRLACQVRPHEALSVEVLNPAPPSDWRATPEGFWQRGEAREHDVMPDVVDVPRPCGVAVDIGTTNLSLSVFELECGRWLADRWGRNPQAAHGSDFISRLAAAAHSREIAAQMSAQVVDALAEALQDIAVHDGFDLRRIVRVVLVGNTAMLALLTGKHLARLLCPEYWSLPLECRPDDVAPWIARWQIHPHAQVEVVQPLAGFVGSDLLAGLVAVRLDDGDTPALFIDAGTNSEVALWDGERLYVTATAGGPAFETVGLGVPAEPGAIYRVTCNGQLEFHTLESDQANGLCGSGLVDLMARLREKGILNERGNLVGGEFRFSAGKRDMVLTKRDVDAFQRAKAAIGAAVSALCRTADLHVDELQRIWIAGAFGRYLDITSAQAVGLVPKVSRERIMLAGNTALSGCADLLLSTAARQRLSRLRDRAGSVLNLAHDADFARTFMEHLYLRPFTTP